jgi:hypothetical protein
MLELHPQFIKGENGEKLFAVLPYDEFVSFNAALEDALDEIDMAEAKRKCKGQETYTLVEVKAKLLARAGN